MSDLYGFNVYNSSGVLTFSLVDTILRVVVDEYVTTEGTKITQYITSDDYTIGDDDFFFCFIPTVVNACPFGATGVIYSATHSAPNSVTFTISKSNVSTLNGYDSLSYGPTMIYIIAGLGGF